MKSGRRPRFNSDDDDGYEEDVESGTTRPLLFSDDVDGSHRVSSSSAAAAEHLMHRPRLQDRFGKLRFRCEYNHSRRLLLVTVIDAWDLPPMDGDGKADPYVEVCLRPHDGVGRKGARKYTTAIKSNCLNPTFNETADLPLEPLDIDGNVYACV